MIWWFWRLLVCWLHPLLPPAMQAGLMHLLLRLLLRSLLLQVACEGTGLGAQLWECVHLWECE